MVPVWCSDGYKQDLQKSRKVHHYSSRRNPIWLQRGIVRLGSLLPVNWPQKTTAGSAWRNSSPEMCPSVPMFANPKTQRVDRPLHQAESNWTDGLCLVMYFLTLSLLSSHRHLVVAQVRLQRSCKVHALRIFCAFSFPPKNWPITAWAHYIKWPWLLKTYGQCLAANCERWYDNHLVNDISKTVIYKWGCEHVWWRWASCRLTGFNDLISTFSYGLVLFINCWFSWHLGFFLEYILISLWNKQTNTFIFYSNKFLIFECFLLNFCIVL